jgi:hypothetical protein
MDNKSTESHLGAGDHPTKNSILGKTGYSSSIENLQLAWRCILEGEEGRYREMMVLNSMEEGKGLHIFKFHGVSAGYNGSFNCEYYFVTPDLDIWKKTEPIITSYDPSIHYVVCVSVPRYDMGDERIQSVRLFNLEDQTEVDL